MKNIEIISNKITHINDDTLDYLNDKYFLNTNVDWFIVMLTEDADNQIGFKQKIIITDNTISIDALDFIINLNIDVKAVNNNLINPDVLMKLFD